MSSWSLFISIVLCTGLLTFSALFTRVLTGWCSEVAFTCLVARGWLYKRLLSLTARLVVVVSPDFYDRAVQVFEDSADIDAAVSAREGSGGHLP